MAREHRETPKEAPPATLRSWNDGPALRTIIDFVTRVTRPGDPGFVPPEERVAVFDNDGTLWCEKPTYTQLLFIRDHLALMAAREPSLRTRQPWKAAYEDDIAWLDATVAVDQTARSEDLRALAAGVLSAFEGVSIEDFAAAAGRFLRMEHHPLLHRPFVACGYRPMIELLGYLEAHEFTTYIASGGGRDFIRPVTMEMYGIPPERVMGSSSALTFIARGDGGDLVHSTEPSTMGAGPVKPVRIWSCVGRRPILTVGNSDVDVEMLEFHRRPPIPALQLLLRHDDAEREFAYTAGAERALAMAEGQGWTVISMRRDWSAVFA